METVPATVIDRPANTELAAILKPIGLTQATQDMIRDSFIPHFQAMRDTLAKCATLTVTDVSQVAEMKAAYAARRAIAGVRVACEKERVALKDEPKRMGQGIDKVASMIKGLCEAEEARLLECETFAERAEAARAKALELERCTALAVFGTQTFILSLGTMSDADYAALYAREKAAYDNRIEVARLQEEARVNAEALRAANEKAMKEENARLQLEAAEARKAAEAQAELARVEAAKVAEANRIEREAMEAKVAAERKAAQDEIDKANKAREEAEAEARKAREAEAARVRAEQERQEAATREANRAKQAAANAPDAAKLREYAAAIRAIPRPDINGNNHAAAIVSAAELTLNTCANTLDAKATELEGGAA